MRTRRRLSLAEKSSANRTGFWPDTEPRIRCLGRTAFVEAGGRVGRKGVVGLALGRVRIFEDGAMLPAGDDLGRTMRTLARTIDARTLERTFDSWTLARTFGAGLGFTSISGKLGYDFAGRSGLRRGCSMR